MDPAAVLKLAVIAAHLAGYSMPDIPPPAVYEVSTHGMDEVACKPNALPDDECHHDVGMYLDGGDIYVDTQYLQSSKHQGTENDIVVHELVHWLQYMHAWGGIDCPHAQARESEAYRVQNQYISLYEGGAFFFVMPVVCH